MAGMILAYACSLTDINKYWKSEGKIFMQKEFHDDLRKAMAANYTAPFVDVIIKLTTVDANRRFFFKGID